MYLLDIHRQSDTRLTKAGVLLSCYHPYIAVPDGVWPSGKVKYKLRKSDYSPDILLELKENDGAILVPCGNCIGCRLDYSKQWANRLMMELQYHDSAYFCTLPKR